MSLSSSSEAMATSCGNPMTINSRPEAQSRRRSSYESDTAVQASAAICASGDREPSQPAAVNAVTTPPAPHRSSTAGRNSPPGHFSPDATIATRDPGPCSCTIQSATAEAFLNEAPTHTATWDANANAIVDPFGDGSTSRLGTSDSRIVLGDRLICPSWPHFVALQEPHRHHARNRPHSRRSRNREVRRFPRRRRRSASS